MSFNPLLGLVAMLTPTIAVAQFNIDDYLRSAISDPELALLERQQQVMNTGKVSPGLVNELELRLRTEDLDVSPEDYRFRVGLRNPAEISAYREYGKTYQSGLGIRRDEVYNELMYDRYVLLISHFFVARRARIERDKLEVLEKRLDLPDALGVTDLFDLDMSVVEAKMKAEELDFEKNEITRKIRQTYPFDGMISWEAFELVQPSKMQVMLSDTLLGASPEVLRLLNELELRERDLALETAQAHSNIAFLQSEFDRDRGAEFEDHLGFQFGFRLPIINPDKVELQYERLELMEDMSEVERAKTATALSMTIKRDRFHHLYQQFGFVDDRLARFDSLDNAVYNGQIETLIRATDYRSRLEILSNDLHHDMLLIFFQIMREQGLLAKPPLRNLLQNDWPDVGE